MTIDSPFSETKGLNLLPHPQQWLMRGSIVLRKEKVTLRPDTPRVGPTRGPHSSVSYGDQGTTPREKEGTDLPLRVAAIKICLASSGGRTFTETISGRGQLSNIEAEAISSAWGSEGHGGGSWGKETESNREGGEDLGKGAWGGGCPRRVVQDILGRGLPEVESEPSGMRDYIYKEDP